MSEVDRTRSAIEMRSSTWMMVDFVEWRNSVTSTLNWLASYWVSELVSRRVMSTSQLWNDTARSESINGHIARSADDVPFLGRPPPGNEHLCHVVAAAFFFEEFSDVGIHWYWYRNGGDVKYAHVFLTALIPRGCRTSGNWWARNDRSRALFCERVHLSLRFGHEPMIRSCNIWWFHRGMKQLSTGNFPLGQLCECK